MLNTILVIDNFASIRDFVCESLRKNGYHAVGASSGKEALKEISERPGAIDLVISDYDMDECTGFEFLKKVKSSHAEAAIEFMFLISETTLEKVKREKETGFYFWVKKPYQMDILFSQIEKIINNHQEVKSSR
jgi:two-component system, chemotaxis family, chemotaxis protein CheY